MIRCFGKTYTLAMVDGSWGDIWETAIWRHDGAPAFEGHYAFHLGDEEEGAAAKVIVRENATRIKILPKAAWAEVILE